MAEPDNSVEILYEPNKVGIQMSHGPIKVTIAFNPEQAILIADLLRNAAQKSVAQTASPKPQ